MVYLAVLLILCGLLILISALFIEKGRGAVSDYNNSSVLAAASSGASAVSEEAEMIFPGDIAGITDGYDEEDIFISFDDEDGKFTDDEEFSAGDFPVKDTAFENHSKSFERDYQPPYRSSGYAEKNRAESVKEEKYPFLRDDDRDYKSVSAVMFDDRSNIIDYEAGVGPIDSTLSKYKSIKRIGKGRIESDSDGVNFYLDEKLYRFDFHKVYDIWSGPGYIALPLKGNSTVKLFLIENSPGFPDKVEADYKEYEKGL